MFQTERISCVAASLLAAISADGRWAILIWSVAVFMLRIIGLYPAGQDLYVAAAVLDESPHKDRDEGCSSTSRSPVQNQAGDLRGQGVSGTSSSFGGGAAESYGDDSSLAGGLVRGSAGFSNWAPGWRSTCWRRGRTHI